MTEQGGSKSGSKVKVDPTYFYWCKLLFHINVEWSGWDSVITESSHSCNFALCNRYKNPLPSPCLSMLILKRMETKVDSVTVSVFTIWIFTMVKQEKRDPKELSETSWLFSLEIDQNDADDVLYVWFNHILCRKIKTLLLFMASIEQRKEPQSLPIQNKPLFIPHSYAPSIFQFHCTLYMCSVHYENDWKSTCGAGCPPAHCGPTQPLFLLLCPVCQPRVL